MSDLRDALEIRDLRPIMTQAMTAVRDCPEVEDDEGICACGKLIGALLMEAHAIGAQQGTELTRGSVTELEHAHEAFRTCESALDAHHCMWCRYAWQLNYGKGRAVP